MSRLSQIHLSEDILGNLYPDKLEADTGTWDFFKEEFNSFGEWGDTLYSVDEPGWYEVKLVESWGYEHTEIDVDIQLTKIDRQ